MSKEHEHGFMLFYKRALPALRQKLDKQTIVAIGIYTAQECEKISNTDLDRYK